MENESSYLLQLRDNKEGIHYPGKIGLFGGLIEIDENPRAALIREVEEELSITLKAISLVTIMTLDNVFTNGLFDLRRRYFFVAKLNQTDSQKLVLREGQALIRMECLSSSYASEFVPYDLAFLLSVDSARRVDEIRFGSSS